MAEKGLHGVRASEVVKAAGHRNNSAIAYHFGSWENLLAAVWELHTVPINADRAALIAEARAGGTFDLATMVRAYVEPLVADLARHRPSFWARFSEQWMASMRMDFFAPALEPEAYPVSDSVMVLHGLFSEMSEALDHLTPESRPRRVALMSRHVIAALAAWEREDNPAQPLADLQRELLSTAAAILQAP